jgi:hypothetical protein
MLKKSLILMSAILFFTFPSTTRSEEKVDLQIAFYGQPDIATTFRAVLPQGRSKVAITLSDGSQWIVRNDSEQEAMGQISAHWKSGDEIRIDSRTPDQYQGKYILKNARNGQVCLVDLDSACVDAANAYYIEKIDQNGYAIATRDGLEWAIGWYGAFTTRSWKRGDRIIINKSHYSSREDYLLIDADKGTDVWASLIHWK